MVHRLRILVLLLILGMVVLSPFMQLDSWDDFPGTTGDLELHVTGLFSTIGMFLVFVGIMRLCPSLFRSDLAAPPLACLDLWHSLERAESVVSGFSAPLRI